jgi:hypothetical protein
MDGGIQVMQWQFQFEVKGKVTLIFATKTCRIHNLVMHWLTTLKFGREVVLEL